MCPPEGSGPDRHHPPRRSRPTRRSIQKLRHGAGGLDFLGALLDQIGYGAATFRQKLFSPSAKGFDDLLQRWEWLGSQLTVFCKRPVKPKACGNAGLSDKGRWQGDLVFHCDGRSHCKKVLQGHGASSAKILTISWGTSRGKLEVQVLDGEAMQPSSKK